MEEKAMKMMIEGVDIPVRKTVGSCGYDLHCPIDITLEKYKWKQIDMGLMMEEGDIPYGFVGIIVPRSSTGMRWGLRLKNTIGVIDSDYTMDTIKATLTVDIPEVHIKKNERILQMIVIPFGVIPSEELPISMRTGGVGSTGL